MRKKADAKVYRIRDKKNGQWCCYGRSAEFLETTDITIASDFVDELADYGITAEVVLVEP